MEWLYDFLAWAWDRHHNILSWYIRPLFLLPYVYFAYKRSLAGISLTLVALATSMFWFPKPEQPDPRVLEFLAREKAGVPRQRMDPFGGPSILARAYQPRGAGAGFLEVVDNLRAGRG